MCLLKPKLRLLYVLKEILYFTRINWNSLKSTVFECFIVWYLAHKILLKANIQNRINIT